MDIHPLSERTEHLSSERWMFSVLPRAEAAAFSLALIALLVVCHRLPLLRCAGSDGCARIAQVQLSHFFLEELCRVKRSDMRLAHQLLVAGIRPKTSRDQDRP